MGRLFGTDGVRGRYGRDLTDDLARGLGRAATVVLRRHGEEHISFVIGRDPRVSGAPLERALADGITSAGGDAYLLGIEPTPAVAYLTAAVGHWSGVMISASHNPPEDNGIKFFDASGFKLSDALEDEIEAEIAAPRDDPSSPGRVLEMPSDAPDYVDHVVSTAESRLDGMRVVVDCANGAASIVAPEALRRLGADVIAINDDPRGDNINVGCGALHPDVVAAEVVRRGADAGVAHDGDADRALFADASGDVIDGDQVLAACALAMHRDGSLENDLVVATVMSNLGLRVAMRDAGIELVETPVGDRYVLEQMEERGAVLGGEQSGHVIFRAFATTGDGLITAVRFLSLARRTGVGVRELAAAMHRYPQVMLNVPVADKHALDGAGAVWDAVAEAESALGEGGRVLVRTSGTEDLVRVMVEAETEAEAHRHADAIAAVVRTVLS
jgi:phosphoglucosamine mutase